MQGRQRLVAVLLGSSLLTFSAAQAATYTVTNTNDSGAGSLRQAIADALATAANDRVVFSVDGTITLSSSLPNIAAATASGKLTIDGTGRTVTISGNDAVRPFYVETGGDLTLLRLTVSHGQASDGGGLYNNVGTVRIVQSTFSNNRATSGNGGGLFSAYGGTAVVVVDASTFTGNTATIGWGGGFFSSDYNDVTFVNSTFTGNTAPTYGGAIATYNGGGNTSTVRFVNSTIHGNSSGFFTIYGKIEIGNTILAGNGAYDCSDFHAEAVFIKTGPNIGRCYSAISSDVDPKLGTLADNGGPTKTIALQSDSPAIDAGDDALCAAALVGARDQRGVARPQGSHCDIGAFEVISDHTGAVPEPVPTLREWSATLLATLVAAIAMLHIGRTRQRPDRVTGSIV